MLYYVIININKKRGDIFRSNTLSEVQHDETTVRRLLRKTDSPFTVRMGNRLYADKDLFDKYIADCIKYQINVC